MFLKKTSLKELPHIANYSKFIAQLNYRELAVNLQKH